MNFLTPCVLLPFREGGSGKPVRPRNPICSAGIGPTLLRQLVAVSAGVLGLIKGHIRRTHQRINRLPIFRKHRYPEGKGDDFRIFQVLQSNGDLLYAHPDLFRALADRLKGYIR